MNKQKNVDDFFFLFIFNQNQWLAHVTLGIKIVNKHMPLNSHIFGQAMKL